MIPEYDLNDPASWTVMADSPIDPAWLRALNEIGGLNPFNEPILVPRWGATFRDEMAEDNGLKYFLCNTEPRLVGHAFTDPITGLEMMVEKLDEVPPTVLISIPKYESKQLGERRWIIEKWVSPDFLSRGGRYKETMLVDSGKCFEYFFCRNCDQELFIGNDSPNPCAKCGSKRHYVKEIREVGEGKLLRGFPRRGAYDFFMRLENRVGEYMSLDGIALEHIAREWHRQRTQTILEKLEDMNQETLRQRWVNSNATNASNPFIAPIAG